LIVGATTMAVRVAVEQRKAGSDRSIRSLVDEGLQLFATGLDHGYDPKELETDQEGQA
jgi:hypothetical protein